jgi:hypothetical protein
MDRPVGPRSMRKPLSNLSAKSRSALGISNRYYTQWMHLGVARLCLDCHEVHEHDRCPACTSEAFAFITRWIKLEDANSRTPDRRSHTSPVVEKIDTYRQILQPTTSGSRAGKWPACSSQPGMSPAGAGRSPAATRANRTRRQKNGLDSLRSARTAPVTEAFEIPRAAVRE